jgi:hypothetical protein
MGKTLRGWLAFPWWAGTVNAMRIRSFIAAALIIPALSATGLVPAAAADGTLNNPHSSEYFGLPSSEWWSAGTLSPGRFLSYDSMDSMQATEFHYSSTAEFNAALARNLAYTTADMRVAYGSDDLEDDYKVLANNTHVYIARGVTPDVGFTTRKSFSPGYLNRGVPEVIGVQRAVIIQVWRGGVTTTATLKTRTNTLALTIPYLEQRLIDRLNENYTWTPPVPPAQSAATSAQIMQKAVRNVGRKANRTGKPYNRTALKQRHTKLSKSDYTVYGKNFKKQKKKKVWIKVVRKGDWTRCAKAKSRKVGPPWRLTQCPAGGWKKAR